jgi:hypothetical protein
MDKKILKETIHELFHNTPDYVHSVGYGYKTINGLITSEKSIIFSVIEKKPLNQIPENELLPKSINIDGESVITDVIQSSPAYALTSFRSNCYSAKDSSSDIHRTKHRPLLGGISLARVGLTAGTLGLIVKDKEDGTIVGLTNNHVIIGYPFYTADWVVSRPFVNNGGIIVLQPGPFDGGVDPGDRVGFAKRYDPIWEYKTASTPKNYTDSALCSLNSLDLASIKQIGLDNSAFLPFATTAEIDNLLENANDLFHSGRSTGSVGFPDCPQVVIQESVVAGVSGYNKQGVSAVAYFDDTLIFAYKTPGKVNALVGGDSGSVTIAKIGGVDKVVGLNFAGPADTSYGIMCRIDRAASALNIEPWDTSVDPVKYSYISDWSFITKSGLSSNKVILENGKKYWQVGAQKNGSNLETIYVTYTPSSSTTTTSPPLPPGTTTTAAPTTTPPPTPGNCDIFIKCAFVFDKTDSSISIYLVYDQDYSYTDTYLELEFYDSLGNVIQPYSVFKKVRSYYDVIKLMSTDPYLTVNLADICAVSARLYQPNPCLPSSDSDGSGSDSGSDYDEDCTKTTLGDMTGYLVESIYVEITDNSPCIPEQPAAAVLSELQTINNNNIKLEIIKNEKNEDNSIRAPGDTEGCGVSVKSPCGGGHVCNRAQFDIFLTANSNPDTLVLEANLNNAGGVDGFGNSNPDNGPSTVFGGTWDPLPDGIGLNFYDRYSSSIITKEQNDAIFAGLPPSTGPADPAYAVTVKIVANPVNTNPHLDITWVRIKDTCGRIVYSCCIGEGVLDPDPCCEKGGGPVFPPCPDWDGPPVPGCLPPTSTTPGPSVYGDNSIFNTNNSTKQEIVNLLNTLHINNTMIDDTIIYNNLDKNLLHQTLLNHNINIYIPSYQFDNINNVWISTNYTPDNFILKCSDGNLIFNNKDGENINV